MARTRDSYLLELAETVVKLFEGAGNVDPSDDEIAEAHFPDRALGGEIVEGIRKRLGKIRDVIVQDYNLPVYLVNERYFRRYKVAGMVPLTETEARRCLPGGRGNPMAGICLNLDGDNDLIWQAMIAQGVDAGGGKVRAALDRTLEAVEDGRLLDERAIEILERAREKVRPQREALALQLTSQTRRLRGETAGEGELTENWSSEEAEDVAEEELSEEEFADS